MPDIRMATGESVCSLSFSVTPRPRSCLIGPVGRCTKIPIINRILLGSRATGKAITWRRNKKTRYEPSMLRDRPFHARFEPTGTGRVICTCCTAIDKIDKLYDCCRYCCCCRCRRRYYYYRTCVCIYIYIKRRIKEWARRVFSAGFVFFVLTLPLFLLPDEFRLLNTRRFGFLIIIFSFSSPSIRRRAYYGDPSNGNWRAPS